MWDVTANKKVNTLEGHSARVGALAWNGDSLSSGSRDRLILQRDVRTPSIMPERRMVGHRQEVCGLKWSPDNQYLASGGNDNKLFVWSGAQNTPMQTYSYHVAAVKVSPCNIVRMMTLMTLLRPSPGHLTIMGCWPVGAAPRTGTSGSGTR